MAPTFKCCKKAFIHYVCTECSQVFHKSCLMRKKNVQFTVDHKIKCNGCNSRNPREDSGEESSLLLEEKSLLEKTISDLTVDSDEKDTYIQRLRREKDLLLDEAMRAEEELTEVIRRKDVLIEELQARVSELERINGQVNKPISSVGTQTCQIVRKNSGVQTDVNIQRQKDTTTQTYMLHEYKPETSEHIFPRVLVSVGSQVTMKNAEGSTQTEKTVCCEKNQENIAAKADKGTVGPVNRSTTIPEKRNVKSGPRCLSKILILSDEIGRGIVGLLRGMQCLSSFEISSFIKPNACLEDVMADVEKLTRDFTKHDFVFILGGFNNFGTNCYPNLRLLSGKLRQITHTNVIMSSVPYTGGTKLDRRIFLYNSRLYSLVNRLDAISEASLVYHEINRVNYKHKRSFVLDIVDCFLKRTGNNKNLIYITPVQISTVLNESKIVEAIDAGDLEPSTVDEEHFLCHRLPQMSLMEFT